MKIDRPGAFYRIARLFLAGLGLGLGLGGCHHRARAAGGRVVIHYWEKWTGFEADAMRSVIDDFNRSQTHIEVKFLSVTPIDVKLLLAASAGDPPDVAGLWSYSIPDFAEKGALTPLDGALKKAGLGEDHYVPIFWKLCRYKGFTWGLPTTPGCVALWYNKKLFREAGLDPDRPPRTFAELQSMSRRLTVVEIMRGGRLERLRFDQLTAAERAARKYRIIQVGMLPSDAGMFLSAWGFWFGAKYYDGDRRIIADDPGMIAAYRWMRDSVRTYGLENLRDFGAQFGQSQTSNSPFLAGREAMVVNGPWLKNFIDRYAPDVEWGVAPCPAAPGVSDHAPMTLVESDVVVIPKGAPHPEEAFAFIRYLQRPEVAEKLARLQQKFTALREVTPGFYATHPNPAIREFAALARSPGARYVPRLSNWREYDMELSIAADNVRSLRETPEEALAVVQKRVQWSMDRITRRWDVVGARRMQEWRDYDRW